MQFPKHFLFGAALSAHQVEGNNVHSNWWHAEQNGFVPPSGIAADHYHQFDSDFAMGRKLGLNAMRISLEWSRLQPKEGVWDKREVEHYHHVFRSLRHRGFIPMVTLFHWTMPQWLLEKGGFETYYGLRAFRKFVRGVASEFGKECQLWITINEPEVFAFESYFFGKHPPFGKSLWRAWKVYRNLIKAHFDAHKILKLYIPHVRVGVAKNVAYHLPHSKSILDRLVVWIANKFGNECFIEKTKHTLDFIGLNYYFTHRLKFSLLKGFENMNEKFPMSEMGTKTFPQGLYYLLRRFQKYDKPLYVTENGIANAHDKMREQFIREHIKAVHQARQEGVQIKGYFYWSLIDTYEFRDGFDRKFGLAEVNYSNLKRTPRISAQLFNSFRKR